MSNFDRKAGRPAQTPEEREKLLMARLDTAKMQMQKLEDELAESQDARVKRQINRMKSRIKDLSKDLEAVRWIRNNAG